MGPQDGEQNTYGQLKQGIEHADFIHMRAPKPTLILTTTRDAFNIPHDLKILQQVFKVENGDYNRRNDFWESHDLIKLAGEAAAPQIDRIKQSYDRLSATYQASKDDNSIPLN